jgi:hypothetical protein
MSYTDWFTPRPHDKHVVPAHRPRSLSRRVRRFAFALFGDFSETILLALDFGTMTVALIMSKFATWPLQFTN